MVCNIVVVDLSRIDYFLHRKYEIGKLTELKERLKNQGVSRFVCTQEKLSRFEKEIVELFETKSGDLQPDMALFITSDPQFLTKHIVCDNDIVYYIIY